ncbi:MAG: hypothetical protein WBM23_11225 [Desulfomonilia bacterium]|jgi:hypothetical protein
MGIFEIAGLKDILNLQEKQTGAIRMRKKRKRRLHRIPGTCRLAHGGERPGAADRHRFGREKSFDRDSHAAPA